MTFPQRGQIWVWRTLHFLLALAFPALLSALLLGCIKAKEEPADLGPEVPEEQIDLALSKAVKGATVSGTAVGQFVTYSITRRLENEEAVNMLGASKTSVVAKTEDPKKPNEIRFTLNIVQSTRMEDGTFETVEKEAPLIVAKPSGASALVHGEISAMAKPIRRTYHRLRESTEQMDPPEVVRKRPDCGGLTGCKIPAKIIQYDIVDWYSETEFRKLAFSFTFSTAVPWLPNGPDGSLDNFTGLLLQNCVATQVLVTGRTVFVRDCVNLEDFQK